MTEQKELTEKVYTLIEKLEKEIPHRNERVRLAYNICRNILEDNKEPIDILIKAAKIKADAKVEAITTKIKKELAEADIPFIK